MQTVMTTGEPPAATMTGPPHSRPPLPPPRAARPAQMLSGTPGSAMPAAVTGHRGFWCQPVPALLECSVMAAGPVCRRFRADITEIGFRRPFFTPRRKYPDGRNEVVTRPHHYVPEIHKEVERGTRLCLLPRARCRASRQDPGRQPVGQRPRVGRPRPAPHRQDDRPGTRREMAASFSTRPT
jgi:hypothetical protein